MDDREMLRYWVLLSMIFGAGGTKVVRALRTLHTPKNIYEAARDGRLPRLTPAERKSAAELKPAQAESMLAYCERAHIALIPITDRRYPDMLRSIPERPFLLTAHGAVELLKKPLAIAVVGTRTPSDYSRAVTERIVGELCRNDFVIVSGFAKGIDTAAHTAALRAGGATIAVLGCGVDVDYPRPNGALRQEMLQSGRGLLLSEYLPGAEPFSSHFPMRNRILSGLAYATAVMEAATRSGSLVTAKIARQQGRQLLCVPPADIFDPRYAGGIQLLRDGVRPMFSAADVLALYAEREPQLIYSGTLLRQSERAVYAAEEAANHPAEDAAQETAEHAAEQPAEAVSAGEPEEKPARKPRTSPEQPAPPAETPAAAQRTDLPESADGARIVQYLRAHGSADVDTLAEALQIERTALLSTLMLLELSDYVTSLFGKQYAPA